MINTNNFLGFRVLIRSAEAETTLTDTAIVAFDKMNTIITVNASILQDYVDEHVSLLIFGKGALYEYMGTIRRYNSNGNTEIALFRGKVKESRAFRRYPLKANGTIIAVKEQSRSLALERPVPVELVNISATGVLFRAKKQETEHYLNMGKQVRLLLDMNHNRMEMECIIVRKVPSAENGIQCACKFAAVEKV